MGQSLGDAPAQIHAEWLVADARQQIDGLQRDQGRSLFDVGGHNGLVQLATELEGLGGRADDADLAAQVAAVAAELEQPRLAAIPASLELDGGQVVAVIEPGGDQKQGVEIGGVLERMTLDEKIAQLGCVWSTRLVEGDATDTGLLADLAAECDQIVAGAARIGGITYFHEYAYDLLAENERIVAATFDAALAAHGGGEGRLQKIVVRDRVHDGTKMTGKAYRVPKRPVAPGSKVPDEDMRIIEAMPVKSLVTFPKSGATLATGAEHEVRGHAWVGDGRIDAVHVSVDFGSTWQVAAVEPPPNRLAWQRWRARIRLPKDGYYEVWARATDDQGRSQPMVVPGWNPKGYLNNACHRIAVLAQS